jgi:hypothetical protein
MENIKGAKLGADMPMKPQRILPSFSLTSDDLPELKDWKVGGVYFLKIKVEQTSLAKGQYEWETSTDGKKTMNARFQIKAIEPIENKETYEDEYARKRGKKS